MSWLFKDPVVWMVLLNYDQTQLNTRKWPKKNQIVLNEIFPQKTSNKIFMYLSASFIE